MCSSVDAAKRVVLNVGGLRHETYKTTLKIGRFAAGRSTQRR